MEKDSSGILAELRLTTETIRFVSTFERKTTLGFRSQQASSHRKMFLAKQGERFRGGEGFSLSSSSVLQLKTF